MHGKSTAVSLVCNFIGFGDKETQRQGDYEIVHGANTMASSGRYMCYWYFTILEVPKTLKSL